MGTERWGVCDVHGHYLPPAAMDLMGSGPIVVGDGVGGESISVNGMPVGATVHQLSAAEEMIVAMNRAGVDHRVLTPPPFTYRYWADPADGIRLCRLINDAVAEVVGAHPDRFSGLATVPLQDPAAAVVELDRGLDELGLLGLGVGTNLGGKLLSDLAVRRVFARAEERNAAVLVHPDFVPSPRYGDYYLVNLIGMPVETGTTVANMMMSGMLEQLPALRVCFVHGGGIAPYLLGRWSRSWHVRVDTSRDSTRPPEDLLGSLYWDTLTHSVGALEFLIGQMGADHVVLGTDAPFDVEDADPVGQLDAVPGLSGEERHRIRSLTPLKWLHGADAT
ncbi:MAG TPA: amidohydrolase family protein [Acidimicrobiia bacterium]|nr:amidohydrolase family protein [Acidimicrobiia bacterium]